MEKKPKSSDKRPRDGSGGAVAEEEDVKIARVRARLVKSQYHGRDLPGAAGESSAGAEEDTYD